MQRCRMAPRQHCERNTGASMIRDYRPLGRYFRALTTDSATLSFQEIEHILGATLQNVARRSKTFWQNSNPARLEPDGHWWTYEWMNAGRFCAPISILPSMRAYFRSTVSTTSEYELLCDIPSVGSSTVKCCHSLIVQPTNHRARQ